MFGVMTCRRLRRRRKGKANTLESLKTCANAWQLGLSLQVGSRDEDAWTAVDDKLSLVAAICLKDHVCSQQYCHSIN